MNMEEILNAFAKAHPELVERYNIICYPCDIHDANKFKILVEERTFPFTTFAEYLANVIEGVPQFENIEQKIKNSNRACCYTCNKNAYDMERRTEFCLVTNEPTKPWNDCTCNAHEWPQTAGE